MVVLALSRSMMMKMRKSQMSGEGTFNEKTEDLPGEEDKIDIEMVDTLQINNDLLLSPNGAIASEEQP